MGEVESLGPGSLSVFLLRESLDDCRVYDGGTPDVVGEVGSFSDNLLRIAAKLPDDPPDCVFAGGS